MISESLSWIKPTRGSSAGSSSVIFVSKIKTGNTGRSGDSALFKAVLSSVRKSLLNQNMLIFIMS